jgi:hypothetical protein
MRAVVPHWFSGYGTTMAPPLGTSSPAWARSEGGDGPRLLDPSQRSRLNSRYTASGRGNRGR